MATVSDRTDPPQAHSIQVAPDRTGATPARRPRTHAETIDDLYQRHGRRIQDFCAYRLGSREEAEDATQLTFLNAYRGLRRGTTVELEAAWLYRIAENVCSNSRRSSVRRGRVEAPVDPVDVDRIAGPSHERPDELIWLESALASMPEQQRRAILLREWQGLSYKEISAELGLSQAAVETLLFRARRSLAERLEETPPAPRRRRLRALTDVGSLGSAIQGFLFAGGAKTAATLATVAAATVVAATPGLREGVADVFRAIPVPFVHGSGGAPAESPASTEPRAKGSFALPPAAGQSRKPLAGEASSTAAAAIGAASRQPLVAGAAHGRASAPPPAAAPAAASIVVPGVLMPPVAPGSAGDAPGGAPAPPAAVASSSAGEGTAVVSTETADPGAVAQPPSGASSPSEASQAPETPSPQGAAPPPATTSGQGQTSAPGQTGAPPPGQAKEKDSPGQVRKGGATTTDSDSSDAQGSNGQGNAHGENGNAQGQNGQAGGGNAGGTSANAQNSNGQGSNSQGSNGQGSNSQASNGQASNSSGSNSQGSAAGGQNTNGQSSGNQGSGNQGSNAEGSSGQGSSGQASSGQGSNSQDSSSQGSGSAGSSSQGPNGGGSGNASSGNASSGNAGSGSGGSGNQSSSVGQNGNPGQNGNAGQSGPGNSQGEGPTDIDAVGGTVNGALL